MAQFLTPPKKNMTVGEKRFANLLKAYLDDDYLVWFDIPTNSKIQRFPDFLIFNPNYGLWCIEIKDWALGNMRTLSKEYVKIKQGETLKQYANPIFQARGCLLPVINELNQDKLLLQTKGKHQGKLAFPWGFGAVMTRWKISNISDSHLEKFLICFPKTKTFFNEETGDNPLSKTEFIDKLHGILPYRFGNGLSKLQADRVRAHIFPEFIIEQKSLFEDDEAIKTPNIVAIMDNTQETLARSLGNGHRVIHGVAGSGKTIILEHRAKALAEKCGDEEVLVVCFNILLARRLAQRLKSPNIKVMHYHGWCNKMCERFGLNVPDGHWRTHFQRLEEVVLQAIDNGQIPSGLYHAVLIDEGHDFAPEWLMAMSKMPNPENEHLLLLYDDAQSIYDNRRGLDFTLSSVGIKARGRTTVLHTNYRNSQEILITAERFILKFLDIAEMKDDDDIPLLSIRSGGMQTGEYPVFQSYPSLEDECLGIIRQIKAWETSGIALGDIAILYKKNYFAEQLKKKMTASGITLNSLISNQSRKKYQHQENAVTLCSIASSKGSEFSHVILAGLGDCEDQLKKINKDARLIYVGMTRARNALFMTASQHNAFTEAFERNEYRV